MDGTEQQPNDSPDGRHTRRADVQIEAKIREAGGGKFRIDVLNLSETGFRMRSLTFLNPESRLYLTMPGMAPLAAKISWSKDDYYGCTFENALYPAVFDHIVSRFSGLGRN